MESTEKSSDGESSAGPVAKREKLEKLDVLLVKDNNLDKPKVVLKRIDRPKCPTDQVIPDSGPIIIVD